MALGKIQAIVSVDSATLAEAMAAVRSRLSSSGEACLWTCDTGLDGAAIGIAVRKGESVRIMCWSYNQQKILAS